jgi:hypothetical protein
MDKIAGVLLIAVLIFAWMFRYEVTYQGDRVFPFTVLDRWTGKLTECISVIGTSYGSACPRMGRIDEYTMELDSAEE